MNEYGTWLELNLMGVDSRLMNIIHNSLPRHKRKSIDYDGTAICEKCAIVDRSEIMCRQPGWTPKNRVYVCRKCRSEEE